MIHHILDLVIRIFQNTSCTSNHSKNSCSFPLRPGEITHARMHFPSIVVSTTCFFFLSSFDVSKTRSAHSWSLDYEWMAQSIHGRRLKKKKEREGAPPTHTHRHTLVVVVTYPSLGIAYVIAFLFLREFSWGRRIHAAYFDNGLVCGALLRKLANFNNDALVYTTIVIRSPGPHYTQTWLNVTGNDTKQQSSFLCFWWLDAYAFFSNTVVAFGPNCVGW